MRWSMTYQRAAALAADSQTHTDTHPHTLAQNAQTQLLVKQFKNCYSHEKIKGGKRFM